MLIRFRLAAASLATALAVAGCSTSGPGPFGPRYQTEIPTGSTLVLNQTLELAPGEARVFMQNGQVAREGLIRGLDRFQPRCSFGLERERGERLISTIEPDRFTTGEARTRTYVRAWPEGGVQVAASTGVKLAVNSPGGPDPGYFTYEVEIPISSPRQPQVDDFRCTVDRPNDWRGKLGLQAIRKAARDLVTVELADSGAGTDGGY